MKPYLYNWRALLATLACLVTLSGCQSLPAAPEHKYYRLLVAPAPPAQQAVRLPGELAVRPLRAEGLYSERAIIFSDEQQRQLQQYHYHHWLYAPGQLVQEHLAASLNQAGIATAVRVQARGGDMAYTLSGRIVHFEKVISKGQAKASVALELRLEKKGRLLWQKTYAASESVPDGGMNGFTAAMEVALNRIYGEFLVDLGRNKLD